MCMVTEDSFETKTEGTDGKQSKCAAIVLKGFIPDQISIKENIHHCPLFVTRKSLSN